ncbi:class I SAM-dependent methyltransferase [Methanosarcina sp.]|uniref:class I SAM-dependent methyltransferase n=1 Tax=Methanosarcina sp. TaxID=2213 RepID=UPI002988C907|nr:class I SAM-dependent methyltransferase [Methanosarcina sp.]MDW5551407.1 class I SAM-dependent methyltransferase [Methanosarcina sp.]MDW5554442.1 class I SAM-dependent methyltransferase [Methanosarcina sp.]MDW5559055.1 class I SAM-dependent methyltransferase [Methanosarcina sp.]
MNFTDILEFIKKPQIYTDGNAVMWTDGHISKQLLDVHLNPDIDLASRRGASIESTVDWILNSVNLEKMNILDLGCGPGLYAELMAKRGHKVTGVDFSKNSIEYARSEALKKNLDIEYVNQNYLELCEENKYDLAMMLFTDFGVLTPIARKTLLQNVYRALKPNGTFIFDVLSDKDIELKVSEKSWEMEEYGFWKDRPYLVLSDSYYYPKDKVILYQHIVIDDSDNFDVYRFWTHFFTSDDMKKMLVQEGFEEIECYDDILPDIDLWNGDNVIFCKATKIS